MKKRQITAMLMAGAMCMGMLAGCGNKDDGQTGGSSDTFTIGVVGPLTGDAAIYGTNVDQRHGRRHQVQPHLCRRRQRS